MSTRCALFICLGILVILPATTSGADPGASTADLPKGYVAEAPLPERFPAPSEPGEVVEKSYPVVRSYSATGAGAFMKCFGYLTTKQHKMTAPVVMDYSPTEESDRDDMPVPISRMHFLLENNALDNPGQVGQITVADLPAMRVLSIAYQGEMSTDRIKAGRAAIEKRLAQMSNHARAGEYRFLGYNSPMVERGKKYWELQLPITAKVNPDELGSP